MDEHTSGIREPHPRPSRPHTTLVTNGAAGAILILGAGAAYLLSRAGPEALATTSRVMMTTGLAGLLVMAVVVVRLSRASRDPGGGHRHGPDRPPETTPRPTTDDLDAELFRMINEERLRDTRTTSPDAHPGPRK
jgi:hypothetical protein